MIVMKFGGSSVGTAEAMRQVASIVQRYREVQPVLVVSALQGITDELLLLARSAAVGQSVTGVAALIERHRSVAAEFSESNSVSSEISRLGDELASVLKGVSLLGELSDRSLDLIVSFGERLSAPIVAAALRDAGLAAQAVDSRELIVTDAIFTSARVDFMATKTRVTERLAPLVANVVPVVTGFIAATSEGATTTLGRGGSDYSVAIIAGALRAEEIWIWKEVDGVMSADPHIVAEAALLDRISYDEAAELSYFGAKVLHPKTMIPAVEHGIPIRMRNTFRPDAPGTLIGTETSATPFGVKAVTAMTKLAVVTIEGKGMAGIAGFAAHIFSVAGRSRVNIVMFNQSSSEQTICLVVEAKDAAAFRAALERELRDDVVSKGIDRIVVQEAMAAVAVVGDGMRGKRGIAARVFSAVADSGVSVLAISQGSSERNISFVVPEADVVTVVRAVHAAFELQLLGSRVCV